MIKAIHHLVVVVSDLNGAIRNLHRLGLHSDSRWQTPHRQSQRSSADSSYIELIAFTVRDSPRFRSLAVASCPFQNLPESRKGRWGEGLTAEDMGKCRWLQPRLVAAIEFAEWTPANHLRHSKFIALREDKDADQVRREAAIEAQAHVRKVHLDLG